MKQLQKRLVSLYNRMQQKPKSKELKKQYLKVLMELDKEMQKQPLPLPIKKLTKEEFKNLTNQERIKLVGQDLLQALQNPANHRKLS